MARRDDEDAKMRAEMALLQLERPELDDDGQVRDKHYWSFHLKKQGLTWEEVAKRLGYSSAQAAHRAAKIYQDEHAVRLSSQEQLEWLEMQLNRCEAMIKQYWQAAQLGDTDAAQIVLRYMQEESKYARLYEEQSGTSTTKYVVINGGRQQYASELREIALSTKELGSGTKES